MPRKRILYQGKFIRLVSQDGWEFVERHTCSGIVIILAVTDKGKLLFVEQFRTPVGKKVIELPAGLVDDQEEREGPETAARRELLEETGYEAKKLEHLVTGPVNTGLSADVYSFYRARGLVRRGPGGGADRFEDITVHEVPLNDVPAWLEKISRKGLLIDPKVYAGLYFLNQ